MFHEPSVSVARTCAIILAVFGAWIAGGAYLLKHPLPAVAEAIVHAPPGTDPETLCTSPAIVQAALDKLAEFKGRPVQDDAGNTEAERPPAKLSGTMSARKAFDGSWKISYQAPNEECAVNELTALVRELERHLAIPKNEKLELNRRDLEVRLQQLNLKQAELQSKSRAEFPDESESNTDGTLAESNFTPETAGLEEPIGVRERINALQRAVTEARIERLRTEEEVGCVEKDVAAGKKMEAIANQLSSGPVQDAVRQVDRQARLSSELKQVNTTLSSDSEIYGDKHPRLIELRRRFERLLQEVGGWEHLLSESAVSEHLTASLVQVLELRRERESDLQIQLDLEQTDLQDRARELQNRTRDSGTLKTVTTEIAATKKSLSELNNSLTSDSESAQTSAVRASATLLERFWPWSIVLVAGLLSGWIVNHFPRFESQPDYQTSVELPLLTVPRVLMPKLVPPGNPGVAEADVPTNETLDLAQRRAARQARWQQTYA